VFKPNDLVVSVCDAVNEELAELPNKRIHWSIPDPARINTDKAFRDAFDEIAQRIARLANSVN
jgi:protein-tyrosine-phosphatase